MESAILIVYGGGGHKEEAERLMDQLQKASPKPIHFVALCENNVKPSNKVVEHFFVPEFRRKDVRPLYSVVDMLKCSFSTFGMMFRVTRKYNIKLVISTGPGLVIPCFAWCRIFRVKTLFMESWCRFYQRSFSGGVCRFLANRVYYQNKSLAHLYPKGRWSGRL